MSPKLKQAAKEVLEVLKRHDVAGSCALADGEAAAEFVNHLSPSWSALTVEGPGIRFKAKAATGGPLERAKAHATINMVHCFRDVHTHCWAAMDKLVKLAHQHFDIEVSDSQFIPHREPPAP